MWCMMFSLLIPIAIISYYNICVRAIICVMQARYCSCVRIIYLNTEFKYKITVEKTRKTLYVLHNTTSPQVKSGLLAGYRSVGYIICIQMYNTYIV